MSIFVIADLHLSFRKPKPMDIFGDNWQNHEEKIKKDWNEKVKEEAKENNSEQLEVNIAKHRNGETTKFYLAFEANTNACMNYANVSE